MHTVAFAFHRWLNAEQDVHDANLLLINALYTHDQRFQMAQQTCVSRLRQDAARCLRDYLEEVELQKRQLRQPPMGMHNHLHYLQLPYVD